jgi:glycosyltransferase involved in cell wall biosynthesis
LRDIEVIIVNDASTDRTWDIIMECEAQFPDLVMAINSDVNRGAGGARNIGLMYASGEYIGFVDSDDIIRPDMYEKLYNEAVRGNYDMVDSGYYNEKDDLAMIHTSDELAGDLDASKRRELIASGGYLVTRIFKRELIFDSGIQFRENAILEDCEYLMFLLAKAKRLGNVKEILYNYRYYKESSSNEFNPDKYYNNIIS